VFLYFLELEMKTYSLWDKVSKEVSPTSIEEERETDGIQGGALKLDAPQS
jgi:hypothetical protein